MYYAFEALIKKYLTEKVYVNIQELEEEGLLQEFCDRVEKISPTKETFRPHLDLYYYLREKYGKTSTQGWCFALLRFPLNPKLAKFITPYTMPTIYKDPTQHEIAHLISNRPPVDMEELLKM